MILEIIRILHITIIIFVILSVFVKICWWKKLALLLLLFMAFQYITGYETCGLTVLEYKILGQEKHQQGFLYRTINPFIKTPEKYFNNYYWILHLIWILILSYQIYYSDCDFLIFDTF